MQKPGAGNGQTTIWKVPTRLNAKLGADATNLYVKPVAGHAPWRRPRVGEHRVLYRELADEADAHYLVERVIDRRDLDRAIDRL
jgi:hypothetical protein